MSQVLVTGANGFIGKHLLRHLSEASAWQPIAASRVGLNFANGETRIITPELSPEQWDKIVAGCDIIIHTAARAHIQQETAEDPVALYRQVNVSMTKHLAKAAINAGVKRFIFISSAGVHGRESKKPFTEQDPPAPDTDYTRSKLEAEQILFALAKGTNMQVTILRLPLVYGAEVKGNFLSMLHILEKNIPLPLGSINNKRSLLYIDNLLDFIVHCLDHPAVENEIFLLADEAAISTPDLLRLLRDQLHSKTWIFSLPIWVLKVMAFVVHRQEPLNKLMASFEVDGSKARRLLDWHPPVSMRSGIAATTAAFRKKIEEGPLD